MAPWLIMDAIFLITRVTTQVSTFQKAMKASAGKTVLQLQNIFAGESSFTASWKVRLGSYLSGRLGRLANSPYAVRRKLITNNTNEHEYKIKISADLCYSWLKNRLRRRLAA